MSSASVSGCSAFQSPQVVSREGTSVNRSPSNSPSTASPRNWLHSVSVSLSYITRAFMMSLPDTPNVSVSAFTVRAYTMPVKHSGHHVTATGSPPTVSLTISWPLRNAVE